MGAIPGPEDVRRQEEEVVVGASVTSRLCWCREACQFFDQDSYEVSGGGATEVGFFFVGWGYFWGIPFTGRAAWVFPQTVFASRKSFLSR